MTSLNGIPRNHTGHAQESLYSQWQSNQSTCNSCSYFRRTTSTVKIFSLYGIEWGHVGVTVSLQRSLKLFQTTNISSSEVLLFLNILFFLFYKRRQLKWYALHFFLIMGCRKIDIRGRFHVERNILFFTKLIRRRTGQGQELHFVRQGNCLCGKGVSSDQITCLYYKDVIWALKTYFPDKQYGMCTGNVFEVHRTMCFIVSQL